MTTNKKEPVDPARLASLAEVAINVGVRLSPGQDLLMTSPVEALPLARKIAGEAYKAGAGVVTTLLDDDELTLARFAHGNDASFDRAAGWLFNGMAEAFDNNCARLAISADNPMLLANADPDKVGRASKAQSIARKPALEKIAGFEINWSIVTYPSLAWAKLVFPGEEDGVAVQKLAEAIFSASRVDLPDPVSAWRSHNEALGRRTKTLNEQRFFALEFVGPDTNLTVGLADGHEWAGGEATANNGITCNPNIPTEEVFTTPHAGRVSGHVASTKPLSYGGTLIRDISVRFKDGRIVEAKSSTGQQVLEKVLDTDEGARRLGEVALVPHGSPISQSGLLFYNTMFDENAASHIALGQCYSKCFANGGSLGREQISAQGGNQSLIHIDWMIGSGEIDVDGLDEAGGRTPVMRAGEWVSLAQ
ncbi:MAG: aminopeptidase [Alphaproteobacteria bacterium]|nr:aminopeptidase [Alphaproteobacteria bacterium]